MATVDHERTATQLFRYGWIALAVAGVADLLQLAPVGPALLIGGPRAAPEPMAASA
jgi:hypothetical protein